MEQINPPKYRRTPITKFPKKVRNDDVYISPEGHVAFGKDGYMVWTPDELRRHVVAAGRPVQSGPFDFKVGGIKSSLCQMQVRRAHPRAPRIRLRASNDGLHDSCGSSWRRRRWNAQRGRSAAL